MWPKKVCHQEQLSYMETTTVTWFSLQAARLLLALSPKFQRKVGEAYPCVHTALNQQNVTSCVSHLLWWSSGLFKQVEPQRTLSTHRSTELCRVLSHNSKAVPVAC